MFTHPEFKDVETLAERLNALPAHVVYGQLTSDHYGTGMMQLVPSHMQQGFVWWIALGKGHMLGGFMKALLCNDLMGAFGKADSTNLAAMPDWTTFLYNYAPQGSYGSQDAVLSWSGILREAD